MLQNNVCGSSAEDREHIEHEFLSAFSKVHALVQHEHKKVNWWLFGKSYFNVSLSRRHDFLGSQLRTSIGNVAVNKPKLEDKRGGEGTFNLHCRRNFEVSIDTSKTILAAKSWQLEMNS